MEFNGQPGISLKCEELIPVPVSLSLMGTSKEFPRFAGNSQQLHTEKKKKIKLSKAISGCHFMHLHTGVSPLEFHWSGFIFPLLQISRAMLDKVLQFNLFGFFSHGCETVVNLGV